MNTPSERDRIIDYLHARARAVAPFHPDAASALETEARAIAEGAHWRDDADIVEIIDTFGEVHRAAV